MGDDELKKLFWDYKKHREAALKLRANFGHPDKMAEGNRRNYEETLKSAARPLCEIRMLLGREAIHVVPEQESVDDLRQIIAGKTRVDELVDELHEEHIRMIMEHTEWGQLLGRAEFVRSFREGFYQGVYKPKTFDDEAMWEVMDEANLAVPADFRDRKIQITPILVRQTLHERLWNLAKQVASLYLLGQWTAATVFCRALLEDTLKEFVEESDRLGDQWRRQSKNGKEEALSRWLSRVASESISELKSDIEIAAEAIEVANSLIHAQKTANDPGEDDCLRYIKSTFTVAEGLLNFSARPRS